jgi:hypothetical protein
LDLLLQREDNGFAIDVYRKPTHTGRYVHSASFGPSSVGNSIARALRTRMQQYCSADGRSIECARIYRELANNGYDAGWITRVLNPKQPRRVEAEQQQTDTRCAIVPFCGTLSVKLRDYLRQHNIRTVFQQCNTIRRQLMYTNRKSTLADKNVVYRAECTCGQCYIGRSSRGLPKRIGEHVSDATSNAPSKQANRDKTSGLSRHIRDSGHTIAQSTIIERARERDLPYAEAYYIEKHNPKLNDNDGLRICAAWNNLL